MLRYTLKEEEMVSYTLKDGGDGQLHTEGRRRWSACTTEGCEEDGPATH